MLHRQRHVKTSSILSLMLTIIWLVLMIISMSEVKPEWNDIDFVKWVSTPNLFFTGSYINVTLLTIFVVLLFVFLFNFIKSQYLDLAIAGLIFIPVYGVLNLFCYSIQISIVPSIAKSCLNNSETILLVSQLIQANSNSLVGFLNGLAYAILGIPSIIFGLLLIKELKKYSGVFLLLSGVFSIIGFIGYLIQSIIISKGIMIGGVVFLISLISMTIEFKFTE